MLAPVVWSPFVSPTSSFPPKVTVEAQRARGLRWCSTLIARASPCVAVNTVMGNIREEMEKIILLVLLVFCVGSIHTNEESKHVWTWQCDEGHCRKHAVEEGKSVQSVEACKLLCGKYRTLWPKPTGKMELGKTLVPLNPNSISLMSRSIEGRQLGQEVERLLSDAASIFRDQMTARARVHDTLRSGGKSLEVQITILDPISRSLELTTDESYELIVKETEDGRINVTILAPSFFGARHGLETLNQLAVYDDVSKELQVLRDVHITDAPVYPYRGMVLDTARNYFSVAAIKRTIDGMAASKLNTFHWHMTDSQSFPFQSETYPQFSQYGAYSPEQVYTKEDILSVIEYARQRGVRVLPEFDAPAHVGEGWQWAGPNVTACFNAQPWSSYCVEAPCGQLNPTNDKVYEILGGIYKDMLQLFDSDIFHMGGDEVNVQCWRSEAGIVDWMKSKNMEQKDSDFIELWAMFQRKAYEKLVQANNNEKLPVVLWTSHLTGEGGHEGHVDKYLDNGTYIIQIWTTGKDKLIGELVKKGFRVIFSNYDALYFDCGFGSWVGEGNNWCSPYIGWQKVYENDPYKMLSNLGVDMGPDSPARKLVLGAEAAVWSEQVDESSLDGRFWPRAAAMAERLWSNPEENWRQAEYRFLYHRERLVQRGLHAEALEPQWCFQNEGYCPQPIPSSP